MTDLKHTFAWDLPAPADRVFAALTEPAQLKGWLADEAEVEPRVGGAFRFWGANVYGAPGAAQDGQAVTRFEPDRALGFTWALHGAPGEVSLELAPGDPEKNPGGTTLSGVHAFAAAPAIGRAREMVDDLWKFLLLNLHTYLTDPAAVVRPNFADPRPKVEVSTIVEAPVERVFRAFTDPELLKKWIASDATVEARAGGRYGYGWAYEVDGRQVQGGPTRILAFEENRRLVTDWPDWRGDPTVPKQTVTWLFDDLGGRTKVTVIHDGFVRAVDISDYPFGWGHFLRALAGVFEAAEA